MAFLRSLFKKTVPKEIPPLISYNSEEISKLRGKLPLLNGFRIEYTPRGAIVMHPSGKLKIFNPARKMIHLDERIFWPIKRLIAFKSGLVIYELGNKEGTQRLRSCRIQPTGVVIDTDINEFSNFTLLGTDRFLTYMEGDNGPRFTLRLFDPNSDRPIAQYRHELGLDNDFKSAHLVQPNGLLVIYSRKTSYFVIEGEALNQIGISYDFPVESLLHETTVAIFKNPRDNTESTYCFYQDAAGNFISKEIDIAGTNNAFETALSQRLAELSSLRSLPTSLCSMMASFAKPENAVKAGLVTTASPLLMWKTPAVAAETKEEAKAVPLIPSFF